MKKNGLAIDTIVDQQKKKFSTVEAQNILFPSIDGKRKTRVSIMDEHAPEVD